MSGDVELKTLTKVTVETVDKNAIEVTVSEYGKEGIAVTDIHQKVCKYLGLKSSSYKWFSLFSGKPKIIRRLRNGDRIPSTTPDISLRKWCFNRDVEEEMIESDDVACHLVYMETVQSIADGFLLPNKEQEEMLEEYSDPQFLLEKKSIELAHQIDDYFSVIFKAARKFCDVDNQVSEEVVVIVCSKGIRFLKEQEEELLVWQQIKQWTVQYDLRRLSIQYEKPDNVFSIITIETCQAEFLLASIIQLVKEAQISEASESFFYSSMISTSTDGSTVYQNALYSGDQPQTD